MVGEESTDIRGPGTAVVSSSVLPRRGTKLRNPLTIVLKNLQV